MYEPNVGAAQQQALTDFMQRWKAKYGERSASFGASGWDAVMIAKQAAENAHSVAGPALRDAIEKISDFQGAAGVYAFTPEKHEGIAKNPYVVAKFKNGRVVAAE
jgi:branched-chain amino acid transport system substrate-binding protein